MLGGDATLIDSANLTAVDYAKQAAEVVIVKNHIHI